MCITLCVCVRCAGIGLGIAQELLRQGYVVFANGRAADRLKAAFATIPEEHRARLQYVGHVACACVHGGCVANHRIAVWWCMLVRAQEFMRIVCLPGSSAARDSDNSWRCLPACKQVVSAPLSVTLLCVSAPLALPIRCCNTVRCHCSVAPCLTCSFAVGDMSDETDIIRVLAEIAVKSDGTLDVLINNAGATEQGVVRRL